MPGLALAAAQLTVAQAQVLLAVPRQSLRACPALPIAAHHAGHIPMGLIRDQNLDGFLAIPMLPQTHHAHGMGILGQPNLLGEIGCD
jgi:hypothetical protein